MKRKNGKRCVCFLLLLFCMTVQLSGCMAWDVVKDILSVSKADTSGDDGPKVTIVKPTNPPESGIKITPTATPEPTPTEEEKDWIYCASPVNVRAGAGNQEKVLGSLVTGEKVEKLGEERNWIKIRFEGQDGWVYGKYMTEEEP